MDYPKSVPGVGLVDGKFVDEDKSIPRAGSLIPSSWGNAVTEEILAVLRAAGIDPDEANNAQLLDAIRIVCDLRYPRAYSIAALPTENVGPITVIEVGEIWLWTATQYFTGYRSPLCGRPVDGHTVVPLASEVDAVGGTLSKAAYAGLWGYAQENALVVAAASWTSGMHKFVDLGGDNFRCPDLRNQFRRYTGTDADTANARAIGSTQLDASQRIQAAAVIR
ncbi:phage tail protein, partial [Pandoraea pnomenusa]|uniref:phage tail protein n=1 Tax=Pandoraea pnomenusa TaxID=93220 RepID=UPI0012401578